MISLLFIGFLIGMRHALEADHIAAVASLATQNRSLSAAVRQGAVWGLGHTLTLFIFGSVVILMESVMPEQLAYWLEFVVGIMLVLLGIDVIRRLFSYRIHFHTHRHRHDVVHFHAHSHIGEGSHESSRHHHEHNEKFPVRALLVGLMHGMAGSAALILLTLDTIQSPWMGLIYMLLFGLGSILGMSMLSLIIAVPLRASAKRLTWFHNSLTFVIGLFTVGLGLLILLPEFML